MKKIILISVITFVSSSVFAAEQSVVMDKNQFVNHVIEVKRIKDENKNLKEQVSLYEENTERRKKIDELKTKRIKELEGIIADTKEIIGYEDEIKLKLKDKVKEQEGVISSLKELIEVEKHKTENEEKWSTAKNVTIALETILAIALYSRLPKGVPVNIGQLKESYE